MSLQLVTMRRAAAASTGAVSAGEAIGAARNERTHNANAGAGVDVDEVEDEGAAATLTDRRLGAPKGACSCQLVSGLHVSAGGPWAPDHRPLQREASHTARLAKAFNC